MTKLLEYEKKLGDLILLLEKENEDFSNVKKEYEFFSDKMKKGFNNTEKILEIHNRIICIEMQYAYEFGINGDLVSPDGFEENLEYAVNETEMQNIPLIVGLRLELRDLTKNMSAEIWEMYINILEYYTFLETYVPKISYYEGLQLKNVLKYGEILSNYLVIKL